MSYNVLIVDDSRSMRSVIKKMLNLSGFQVGEYLEASNGREALDMLENNWIDLVLSDVHMPVMDGLGLLRAMKAAGLLKDLPVVLVTTEANEERLSEAMALGARGYLRKPFRPEEIRGLLSEILGGSDVFGLASGTEGCDF